MLLIAFTEVQHFSSWPVLLILGFIAVVLLRVFFAVVAAKDKSKLKWLLFPFFLIPLAVLVLTIIMRLDTQLDATGIYYRFYPIHSAIHKIDWKDVDSVYVRTYSPLSEYGGWGIRNGVGGKAYNTSGDKGLQIVFKTKERLLLGTQKPEELQQILHVLGRR